jgi:hypothetical protein
MKTPDAGARFGISWSCAVAELSVFALFLPRVFNRAVGRNTLVKS